MRLRYRMMIPALLAAAAVNGQAPAFHLDNYTIPKGKAGAVIGQVYTPEGAAKGVRLAEDTSGLFTIGKKGEVRLKKKKSIDASSAMQYAVTLELNGQKEPFIFVKDDFARNKIVAHRGAWKHTAGSQNSITSLREAVRLGCEGTEFDVWLSKDGVPVLSHDPHIGGKTVEETSIADLTAIELKNGDRVPTFEQYLEDGMKQNITRLVLELKPSKTGRGEQLAQSCYDLIRKHKSQAWMLYISFDYNICKKLVALDPHAKVAYLNGDKSPAELKADGIWGFDYAWKVIDKDMSIFQQAKKSGVTVNIWTVNDPAQMDTYLRAGTDFLTTDEPEIALEKVKK
ncbi:glycerophosphodiester phosphodiesterase family protein [Chitinophaga sp.]|uniref:glycerophosphodiester phosphodiesterase n=1 Tax=Chitinophaga sp. TaxID=1869181 RepID=UPI00260578CC|nr:glycerophosphodiester phosphodiesterase family protein [uncultured Chitinophaga sp.]